MLPGALRVSQMAERTVRTPGRPIRRRQTSRRRRSPSAGCIGRGKFDAQAAALRCKLSLFPLPHIRLHALVVRVELGAHEDERGDAAHHLCDVARSSCRGRPLQEAS